MITVRQSRKLEITDHPTKVRDSGNSFIFTQIQIVIESFWNLAKVVRKQVN